MMRYIWITAFVLLLVFFAVIAFKGDKIHDNVCPEVKTARAKNVVSGKEVYVCLPRDCVKDGKVYEIYKQKGFFNDNTRVKAVEVTVEDVFPEENLIAITSGIESSGRNYYAISENYELTDGEAVVITKD